MSMIHQVQMAEKHTKMTKSSLARDMPRFLHEPIQPIHVVMSRGRIPVNDIVSTMLQLFQ